MNRIGIYVGLFDPVHAGHIAFALQAAREANLSDVCFLPERTPTHTRPVEHYGHRVAMLKQALQPHDDLSIIETADKRFHFTQTVPRLQRALHADIFTFLCSASRWAEFIAHAPVASLRHHFVIAVKNAEELGATTSIAAQYAIPLQNITYVDYLRPDVATEYVQLALQHHGSAPGLLKSVQQYAKSEWLYVDMSAPSNRIDNSW